MNTIKAFFQIIRTIFSIFKKESGPPSPFIPANCVRHTWPYACILKIIVSTLKNNFNNSIKISCRELHIVSTLTCNKDSFTHVHVDKHNKNPQTILKISKNNPTAFSIFLVVPNFAKILTTVKIVKKLMQAKVLSLKV